MIVLLPHLVQYVTIQKTRFSPKKDELYVHTFLGVHGHIVVRILRANRLLTCPITGGKNWLHNKVSKSIKKNWLLFSNYEISFYDSSRLNM